MYGSNSCFPLNSLYKKRPCLIWFTYFDTLHSTHACMVDPCEEYKKKMKAVHSGEAKSA